VRLTPAVGAGTDAISVEMADAADRLGELYRPPAPDWVRLNLITSVSGSAAGSDGTSETLTNPVDRLLLRVIRDLADVVLVGAASVRAEGYFVPRHSALAVVTGSGDFSGHRITSTGTRGELIILCPDSAQQRVRETLGDTAATIIPVADVDGRLDSAAIIAALHSQGYRSIVCEGGPSLAAQMLNDGRIDEICLTTTPLVNGTSLPLFGAAAITERRLTLNSLMTDDAGCIYARWRVATAVESGTDVSAAGPEAV